jgi:hypothetical protein
MGENNLFISSYICEFNKLVGLINTTRLSYSSMQDLGQNNIKYKIV